MAALAADATYTVAGSEALCGANWDPSQNPMTKNANGLYEKSFTNVPGGSYEFKITDGTWTNSWGKDGNNYGFTLTKASNVTILFNADTKDITVNIQPIDGAEEVEFTYTVAGAQGLCGVEWDPSKNQMTKNADGVHEITFENVQAGTYEFKVTTGSWSASWGENGQNKSITLDAVSNVKILFTPATEKIDVVITPVGAPVPVEKAYYVAGVAALCGEEWAAKAEANQMTKNAQGLYEILYKDVKAGTYEFKITDGTWSNCWGGSGKDGNYELKLTSDGNVKILFNAETHAITVEGNVAPTGDTSNVYLFAAVMLVSVLGMTVLLTRKKAF